MLKVSVNLGLTERGEGNQPNGWLNQQQSWEIRILLQRKLLSQKENGTSMFHAVVLTETIIMDKKGKLTTKITDAHCASLKVNG
jgi:hypothetical protein